MKKISGLLFYGLLQYMLMTAVNSQGLELTRSIRVQTQHGLPDSLTKKLPKKKGINSEIPKSVQAKKSNTPGQIDYVWGKYMTTSYSDRFYSSTIDYSGNVIAAGSTGYGSADVDAIIYKFDSEGYFIWSDEPALSSNNDEIFSVVTDNNRNIYITGQFYSSAFNGMINSAGGADVFIAKYSPDGVLIWAKNAGGAEYDYGCKIALDNVGNLYVVGYFNGTAYWDHIGKTSSTQGDMFIAKYNNQGDIQWVRSGNIGAHNYLHGIGVDKAGNSYVSANFSGEIYFEGAPSNVNARGGTDIFLVKYDTNGNFSWIRTAGSAGDDGGNDTCIDEDGNVLIAGYFTESAQFENKVLTAHGNIDIFAAKYTPNGNLIWVKQFGGTGSQTAWAICSDEKSNCYLTGWFSGTGAFDNTTIVSEGGTDAYVIKYDKNGTLIWVEPTVTGSGDQRGSGVFVRNNKLTVNGYYDNETHIQGNNFPYSEDNDGYLALFEQKESVQTTVYINPYLNLSSSQISAGDSISFSGIQFSPVGKVDLKFSGSGMLDPVIDYAIDVTGSFHCVVSTPVSLKSGQYYVTATDKISGKTVTRAFQVIKEQQAEVDNFLRITEPNISKIRYTDDPMAISWEDKVKFNVNPLFNYKHSYKVEYRLDKNSWILIRDVDGSNPGYGMINTSVPFTPTETGVYTFRISDNYYSNRIVSTPEIEIIAQTAEVKIEYKWDKSYNTSPEIPLKGVAADGVARFYIIVSNDNQHHSGIQSVKVSLFDPESYTATQYLGKVSYCFPQNGNDFTLDGNTANSTSAESNTSNINNKYWFWYVAPDDFARNEGDWQKDKRYIKARFEITLLDGSKLPPLEKDIEIVRPPLMLAHGLNGKPDTWNKFPTGIDNTLFVEDDRFTIKKAVEMWPNSSFNDNANLLYVYFKSLIIQMRLKGYASNRVDYVAHSMGGSILRYAADNNSRYLSEANYNLGYVNKFITLHTPHDGSSFANLLDDLLAEDISGVTSAFVLGSGLKEYFYNLDFEKNTVTITDAVADLRHKGGVKFDETNIQSHLIGSGTSCSEYNLKTKGIFTLFSMLIPQIKTFNQCESMQNYFIQNGYESYFTENNDAIVSMRSQFSGNQPDSLPYNCTKMENIMHNSTFGESPTESSQVGSIVDELLNQNIKSNLFAHIPSTKSSSALYPQKIKRKPITFSKNDRIKIILPVARQAFTINDSINISVQVDTVGLKQVAMLFQDQIYFDIPTTTNIEYKFIVSPEYIENQRIAVLAKYEQNDSVFIASDEVDIQVITSESILELNVEPEVLMIEKDKTRQVEFKAIFPNAISRMGRTDSISVAIEDVAIVAYDPYTNNFTGLKEGNTSATVTYKEKSKTMFFEIIQIEDSLDDATSITELTLENNSGQLNIFTYPNPSSGQVSFEYTLSEAAPTCVEIYNICGVKIKTFNFGKQNKGKHHQQIELSGLSKGVYIYRLTAGNMSWNGDMIKM